MQVQMQASKLIAIILKGQTELLLLCLASDKRMCHSIDFKCSPTSLQPGHFLASCIATAQSFWMCLQDLAKIWTKCARQGTCQRENKRLN